MAALWREIDHLADDVVPLPEDDVSTVCSTATNGRRYLREEIIPNIERFRVGCGEGAVVGYSILLLEAGHAERAGRILAGEEVVGFALAIRVRFPGDVEDGT